jgi:acetoin utilization protein AcuB
MAARRRVTTARVGDAMKRRPVTIGPDAPVARAADLMRRRRIRHLPVVDDQQRLRGIITDRDVQHAALLPALAGHVSWDPRRVKAPRVRDVMTWSAVTVPPDAPLVQAGLLMFERRIGSLPVVDGDRLVGIVTTRDLLEAMRERQILPRDLAGFLW